MGFKEYEVTLNRNGVLMIHIKVETGTREEVKVGSFMQYGEFRVKLCKKEGLRKNQFRFP